MRDTTREAYIKQVEIVYSKTEEERFNMGADMTSFVYTLVKNSILAQNNSLPKGELISEIFKRYYCKEFLPDEIEAISKKIIAFHAEKTE